MSSQEFRDDGLAGTYPSAESNYEHPRTVSRAQDAGLPDGLVGLVTAVRWGTVTVGMLWAAAMRLSGTAMLLGVVLLAYSLWRTYRPVQYRRRGWKSLLAIMAELAVTCSVIVATGCWNSPYIFTLFTPVIAAGFARGFWHSFRIAFAGATAISLATVLIGDPDPLKSVPEWSGELLLVAAVASYGSRLLKKAEQTDALNLTQLWQLNEANALLVSLNRLAQNTPVTFDFQETITSTIAQVKVATNPDLTALLLLEPLSYTWRVSVAEGKRLPDSYLDEHVPFAVLDAAHRMKPKLVRDLSSENPGLSETSREAIYVPLWAGSRQVGLLAVESDVAMHFNLIHVEMLKNISETVAITVDNARWFDRLRARGATQERTRIARDLHDRVGQGVAYVAFELDRLAKRATGTELEADIEHLRTDARTMVSELREALYDLRTDVSDERGFEEVVAEFLNRVAARSGFAVSFDHQGATRLPLAQEREVWRICQEAIVNVERHAKATQVSVGWEVDAKGGALLMIVDDGVGLPANPSLPTEDAASNRPSYGLTGMRERAEAINGVLDIKAGETGGTVVRLALGTKRSLLRQNHSQREVRING